MWLKYIIPRKVNPEIKNEQLRILSSQKRSVLLASILVAALSVWIFWDAADHQSLLIWQSVVTGLALIRIALSCLVIKDSTPQKIVGIHLIATFITGVCWGSLAFFFDPAWQAHYQVALFIIFLGIIYASFVSNISVFAAFTAYMIPVISCLIFVLLQQGEEGYFKISLLVFSFSVVMYEAALRYHNHFVNFLEMRLINQKLTDELLKSSQEFKVMADTDSLTKIANRRTLDKTLSAEWGRHYRAQKPLSFIFIDIDYFKRFNDSYGHQEGDDCLIQVANLIAENVKRSSDLAARYGGEEFAVILPETTEKNAIIIAERIRKSILSHKIPHKGSLISQYVTASLGVATMVPDVHGKEELLSELADKYLYQAKENGRNQCVSATGNIPSADS